MDERKFDKSWAFVHREECWGGAPTGVCRVGDIPGDPGGPTIHGVAKNFHPELWTNGPPSLEVAANLAYHSYWLPAECDKLPWPLCAVVFDWAYNAGEDNPARALHRIVGLPDSTPDLIGPTTVRAIWDWMARRAAQEMLNQRRIELYSRPDKLKKYPGWLKRFARLSEFVKQPL